jgi:general secretion pathway protein G
MRSRHTSAFTLVEILIVVVILGILAAIVVPQFSKAADDATSTATYDTLNRVRRAIAIYHARNGSQWPDVTAGNGTWGGLNGPDSPFMREAPINQWVGPVNGRVIVIGNAPDTAYQDQYGWIYDPATGDVWAGGFDDQDRPFPKP